MIEPGAMKYRIGKGWVACCGICAVETAVKDAPRDEALETLKAFGWHQSVLKGWLCKDESRVQAVG